jgi:hypothetical protein
MKHFFPAFALAVGGLFLTAHAIDDSIVVSRPGIVVFHEFGNISHATELANSEFENYFLQRSGVWVNFKAVRNERLTLNTTLGGVYWNPTVNTGASTPEGSLRYFAAGVPRASMTYALGGEPTTPFVTIEGGIFPYKYNEYSRNLGEYAFRSVAYPAQVFTGGLTWVDMNRAQVTGFRLSQPIGKVFSHDLLLTFETDQLPYYDLNLTYMGKANFSNILKVGAGVQFSRILPLKTSRTNRDVPFNSYFTFNDTTYIVNSAYYSERLKAERRKGGTDTLGLVRGEALTNELLGIINGQEVSLAVALDTLEQRRNVTAQSSYDYYEATSIKTVATFAFDPKALLPEATIFGANDLVLYGEVAVLGLKNHPILYENRLERTVAMVGFNVPTFRQLDVLTFELEWFGSRQPNSSDYSQASGNKDADQDWILYPQPSIFGQLNEAGYSPEDWKKDDIKWSVFASRQLVKGLKLDVQVASDNARGWVYPSGRRYWSYFRSPSDWYWMMKVTASI